MQGLGRAAFMLGLRRGSKAITWIELVALSGLEMEPEPGQRFNKGQGGVGSGAGREVGLKLARACAGACGKGWAWARSIARGWAWSEAWVCGVVATGSATPTPVLGSNLYPDPTSTFPAAEA